MRILVIEDDTKIASLVEAALREAGFAVDIVADGQEGLRFGRQDHYDAAIVDLMLPGLDGLALIEQWRTENIAIPVLILSAKRSVDDRIRGLQAGGDDYMVKPFSVSELLARVHALIRRATQTTEPTTLSVGPLTMDLLTREVRRDERVVELKPREFALLENLMRNAGRVLSKTAILEKVYDYSFDPQTNVVEVLVHRLRAAIDKDFDRPLIRTVRGVGYALER